MPSYEPDFGVTVGSRPRPSYAPLGLHLGDFLVRSDLGASTGYNSNVSGFSGSEGSWFERIKPSLSINSDWTRDQLGAAVTVNNVNYFSTPERNYTDWTATIGGGRTIGRHDLVVGYSHLALHQDPTQIGTIVSTNPIPYQVDDFRANYTLDMGRFSFTPKVETKLFRFGDADTSGLIGQDRVVTKAEFETDYALNDRDKLVVVIRGIDSRDIEALPGVATNTSTSFAALGGIDYRSSGVWQYRLLAGVETRRFVSASRPSRTVPVGEASAIWMPSGRTTVTGTVSRTIEDPAANNIGSYTAVRGRFVVDHEYLRNVLLQARVESESASYFQGSDQTAFGAGGSVQWLLNRNVNVSVDYSFAYRSRLRATSAASSTNLSNSTFNRNVILVGLNFSL